MALGKACCPVVETVLRVESRGRRNRGWPGTRRPLAMMRLHHTVGKASSKLLKVRQPLTLVKSWSWSRDKPSPYFWSFQSFRPTMTILGNIMFNSLVSILVPKSSQLAVRSLLV